MRRYENDREKYGVPNTDRGYQRDQVNRTRASHDYDHADRYTDRNYQLSGVSHADDFGRFTGGTDWNREHFSEPLPRSQYASKDQYGYGNSDRQMWNQRHRHEVDSWDGDEQRWESHRFDPRRERPNRFGESNAQSSPYERRYGRDDFDDYENDRRSVFRRDDERFRQLAEDDDFGNMGRFHDPFGQPPYSGSWSMDPRSEAAGEKNHRGKGPKGYRRSDERIREDVCEEFWHHPELDASDLEVEVKDGVVQLSGIVSKREDRHLAEELVEDLSGVHNVQNNIKVKKKIEGWVPGTGSVSFKDDKGQGLKRALS